MRFPCIPLHDRVSLRGPVKRSRSIRFVCAARGNRPRGLKGKEGPREESVRVVGGVVGKSAVAAVKMFSKALGSSYRLTRKNGSVRTYPYSTAVLSLSLPLDSVVNFLQNFHADR